MAAEQDNIEHTVVQRHDPFLGGVFARRFRIEAKIAAGGFGAIYRATHLKSGHQFALKVLHPNLTTDPGVVARFRREGAALTMLRDPHTITAYELGEADDGTLYIVMELLRGESLYERYRARGAMPWQQVVAIARAVCSSLAEAHALGIIHRDLKPTNIHLEPRGNEHDFVKVLDFGIAKILQDSDVDTDIDSSELTQVGQMIGTLDYMSPEQMVGGICTAPSDIYTLGLVMYEMIAGRKPYGDANSGTAALAAVLTTTPERLATRAIVTPEVDRIVMRCLERQHTDRFQTAAELAAALDEILPGVDEVVTRVAVGAPRTIPGVPHGMSGFASTLPGVAGAAPAIPKPPTGSPRLVQLAARAERAASKHEPAGRSRKPADSTADPDAPTLAAPISKTDPAARELDPADSTTDPAVPKLTPVPRPVLVPRHASVAKLTPVPRLTPEPADHGATLVGHPVADLGPSVVRSRRPSTPPSGTPLGPPNNLREAYPAIHRLPPSPTRPPASQFDARPASSAGGSAPFDMARTVRRDAMFRRLALAIAIAAIVAILVASRL